MHRVEREETKGEIEYSENGEAHNLLMQIWCWQQPVMLLLLSLEVATTASRAATTTVGELEFSWVGSREKERGKGGGQR